MKNKGFAPVVILLIVIGVLVLGGVGYIVVKNIQPKPPLLGGDRDVHGCIGSAGYSWCEAKQKCLRVWEEKCESVATTTYRNDKYGFKVKLPESWKGFKTVESQKDIFGTNGEGVIGHFPEIEIVHPLSTTQNPRQNIPIFIFTADQWKHVGNEKDGDWAVSAAPIPPSELGHNNKYVFALPARYNYAYLPGFEEVQQIIDGKSLTTF